MDSLKAKVTSVPVLRSPELDKQFEVEVNASGYTIGAVLLQRKEDGKKHPIAYYSATLSAAERNYDIYELEYLCHEPVPRSVTDHQESRKRKGLHLQDQ